jgi:RNA-directed DNA polymerase
MEHIIMKINQILHRWINYYKITNCKGLIKEIMSWIRRRLRMIKMGQWKSYKPLHKILRRKGFKGDLPKIAINKWKNSKCYHIHKALPNEYFEGLGLFDLTKVKVEILSCYRE